MSGHLLGAVLVADVRVSFPSGEYDMLRKLHPVAPNIVIGFAGSVAVGFDMVDSLPRRSFSLRHVPTRTPVITAMS